jgi:glycerol-3-phosphate O-acyltransferase/dihydroxyacetone phosphate acyltransferase
MRTLLRPLLRVMLRIFFRRIEVTGVERVPLDGPVIFVLNHPNGLIDPAFLLCLAPRRVAFLAKAPLFRIPIMGAIARAFEAIPVHRRQDAGADLRKNAETFEAARGVLVRGGTIAVFPEGASHSDPKLRPLKTGTARIALGAAAGLPADLSLEIVPVGLYYRAKQTFRSAALLHFGFPLSVERVVLARGAEPPPEPVHRLTTRIESALRDVTLEADEADAHGLVARAQHIFSATDDVPEKPPPLADEFEMRRRFLAGYDVARRHWPDRAARLQGRLERFEASLSAAGLDAQHLAWRGYGWRRVATYALRSALFLTLGLPASIIGWLVHYPAYRAVGWVATGITKGEDDALATVKVVAAALLFPLTWTVVIVAVWLWRGIWPAVLVAPVLPLTGYVALHFAERFDRIVGATRALAILLFRRRAFLRLTAERREIREEILDLGREVEASARSH